ncbi:hypothetical protein HAX54_042038 [Datura stramonium]|uniref:Putative plant transposon protein domain-containing protein n=1 Tax=Datura stramonium TaxID=4076 RepID=A0ABS8W2T7_DATST|nr:hypothetical protein [Datura stramonium]
MDDFPCLPMVKVRGVEVEITPNKINALFWEDKIDSATEFAERVLTKEDQFGWVACIIANDQPLWATMGGDILRKDVKFEVKLWLEYLYSCIISSKNDQRVNLEIAILIAFIMSGVHINFGSATTGVIVIDMRRDTDAPQNKRKWLQAWETTEGSSSHGIDETSIAPYLNMPNPEMSGEKSPLSSLR